MVTLNNLHAKLSFFMLFFLIWKFLHKNKERARGLKSHFYKENEEAKGRLKLNTWDLRGDAFILVFIGLITEVLDF